MSAERPTSRPAPRRLLYLNRRAPHGSAHAVEGLEAVLAGAAFEQTVTVLFVDDGVFQLVRGQDPSVLGIKDFSRTFRALEMYEVERVVVEGESLAHRGLSADDLLIPVEVLPSAEVAALIETQHAVLAF